MENSTDNIEGIIQKTEQCLATAYMNNDDFAELSKFHDTLDIATMSPWDISAMLRSASRVKAFYPRWYEMRDAGYKRLQLLQAEGYAVRGVLVNPDRIMVGMLKCQPTDPKPDRCAMLGIPYFGQGMK